VQILLEKSLHLDATLGPAYLLLGILYSERRDTAHAIAAYQKANVEEAHYRLSQEYRKLGDTDNADKELAIYNQLSQMSAEAAQRERMAIQQFVFTLRH
jgi:tetratricopeptide (TPR) repeat protein